MILHLLMLVCHLLPNFSWFSNEVLLIESKQGPYIEVGLAHHDGDVDMDEYVDTLEEKHAEENNEPSKVAYEHDFGSISTNHKRFERLEKIGIEEDNIRKHTTHACRSPEMWDLKRVELTVSV